MSENAQRRAQELECLACMCECSAAALSRCVVLVSYGCRFEVDNSLTIDDAASAAEHAQVTTLVH